MMTHPPAGAGDAGAVFNQRFGDRLTNSDPRTGYDSHLALKPIRQNVLLFKNSFPVAYDPRKTVRVSFPNEHF